MTTGLVEASDPLVVSPESVRRTLAIARRALRAAEAFLFLPDQASTGADAHGELLSADIIGGGSLARLVVRDEPGREWSEDDRAILRDLAEALGEQIRLSERVAHLEARPSLAASQMPSPAEAPIANDAAPQVAVDGEHPDPASLRILLADDLDLNRKLICDMLSLDGYVVDSVADGAAAVEAVKATAYDLILMDMIMPGMDGLDATRAIRDLPAPACDVPIVALTAHSFREQLDNCLDAGMNATLTKPMTFDALSSAVAEWAGRRNAA